MANVKATFEGLIPSTAYTQFLSFYDGNPAAGGFDFRDAYLMTEYFIQKFGYQDTGYQADMHGTTVGFFSFYGGIQYYEKGYFLSPTNETFNLKTGDFTSAWDVSQTARFTGYSGGYHSRHMTGQITVDINWTTITKIDFANYGSDFRHITELRVFSDVATGGSDGLGWQIVFDNLRVHWNGAVPGHIGSHAHVSHAVMGAMAHAGNASAAHANLGNLGSSTIGYRSELSSLSLHDHAGHSLASQFVLPSVDHFGT